MCLEASFFLTYVEGYAGFEERINLEQEDWHRFQDRYGTDMVHNREHLVKNYGLVE